MSGLVDKSEIDRVRESADLVALIGEHVPLAPKGREHVGLCPFHDDHSPSLTVVTHKGNAFYKCHSCGAAGDVFNFMMDYHKMSFAEALQVVADRAGIRLAPRRDSESSSGGATHADLRRANALAASFYRTTLSGPRGEAARQVIRKRDIDEATSEAFMLGAAPDEWEGFASFARRQGITDTLLAAAGLAKARPGGQGAYDVFRNRLVFPICDELGRPIAFGGRRLKPDDEPKYLNSPESALFSKARTLYGLHLARRAIIEARNVIVTEGYTDVVACHQAGLRNAVATLGTALTPEHARLLKRLCEVVLLVFDGDEAGQRAADRAVEIFFAEGVDVRVCILPGEADPADVLAGPDGRARFETAIAGAASALSLKLEWFRRELVERGLSGRQASLERLIDELSRLGFDKMSGVRRGLVIGQLPHMLGVGIEDVDKALTRRRQQVPAVRPASPATPAMPADDGQDLPTPARRRAERELLGLVMFQPSLRAQPVSVPEAPRRSVRTLLEPAGFRDPAARRLAETMRPWIERDADFTMQELMGALDDPALRSLAGSLYLDAERCLRHAPSPAEHLRELCDAFERQIGRERYQDHLETFRQAPDGSAKTEALRAVVEQRRKQGYVPEAIPSRTRT